MAELLCLRVVLLSLDASLARDGQLVGRISVKLNNVRGNSKARKSRLVKLGIL